MLELLNIAKSFGGTAAIERLNLSIGAGEFFSILGPSGSGKSTLLKLLAGFETPSSGQIKLHGKAIEHLPAHRRPFNMVFQNYALFPHLNVWQNIAFGPQRQRLAKVEIASRVDAALALVAMDAFADRRVQTLSGGQQQRVAIARAIANRPAVLLLDEPLAALDLKLRQMMQVELKRLQRQLGIAFIYVTHAQDEALALSDRIAVMNQGRIEQVGTPHEVYNEPRSLFVASFVGSVNSVSAKVRSHCSDSQIVELSLTHMPEARPLRAHSRSDEKWQPGQAVTCLIRPEALRFEDGPDAFATHVLASTFRGSYSSIELGTPGRPPLFQAEHWTTPPAVGSSVRISIAPSAITVLAETVK